MITINNICFHYKGSKKPVFTDFQLNIAENHIVGLLGENGTGKSTLLYLIAGMLRPQHGQVTVLGKKASNRQADMLRDIFIVPEEYNLPAMRLHQFVKMNRPFYPRFSDDIMRRCLNTFNIDSSMRLKDLSMGQKKKVYMSLALATNTQILLMDEPTNGLDIPSKSLFRQVISENMDDTRLVIISTHQVHDIDSLLDQVVIINERQLLLNASMSEIADRWTFTTCQTSQLRGDELYVEPSMQGNTVVRTRQPQDEETRVNLELLFNALITKNVNN